MAYEFTGASNQHLTIGTSSDLAFDKDDTFTVAGWFYLPSLSNGFEYRFFAKQDASSIGYYVAYRHQVNAGGGLGTNNWLTLERRFSGPIRSVANRQFTATSQTWSHLAWSVTSASTFSAKMYANGVIGTTQSSANTLTSSIINSVQPQINHSLGGNTFRDFRAAEVGVWNAELTADEVASLAAGYTCDKVRPQSLQFYAPLIRNLQDLKAGVTITNNNGATVANHPRVYA